MIGRALAAGVLFTLLAALFAFKAAQKMPDYEVYWRAGARALAAEPLYRADDEHYQFKYLPAFAILASPAALLPLATAKAFWFMTSAALIAVLLAASLALLPVRRRPGWLLAAATAVAMAKFYGHELILGQVNLFFAVVVLAAVHFDVRRRQAISGLLFAVAVVIKPYAVIFVPWIAVRRRFGALAATLAGIGVALLLPVVRYGAAGTAALHRDWWQTVTTSTAPNLLNADNVSLAGMYAKWLGAGAAAWWLTMATAAALLLVTAIVIARGQVVEAPAGLEAALLLTLIPLLSPQGWDYVFLLSTPAVMYLINYDRSLPRPMRALMWVALGTIAFSIYDVMGRQAYAAFMAWSIVSVCYLAIVAALLSLRLRQSA